MAVPILPSSDHTAHRAVVEFMVMDRDLAYISDDYTVRRHKELSDEIESYFGPDALEFTASYFTGHHYAPEEIIVFVATEWEKTKRIMSGEEVD